MILNVLLIIYAALTLVDIVFMWGLHLFHDRKGYYKTATGVWCGIFLAFAVDGFLGDKAFTAQYGVLNHIFGIPLISISTYGLAKLAKDIYRVDFSYKHLGYFSWITWTVGAVLHFVFHVDFMLSSFIICMGIVAPVLVAACRFFQNWKKLNIIDRLFSFILLAEGLHILDYPLLRPFESMAVFGFSLGLLLVYSASMLIPVVINQRISADLNDELERKIEERTLQLLDVKQKLVNSMKMSTLGEMAGGIAHEINSPLGAIKNISGQIQEVIDDEPLDRKMIKIMALNVENTTDRIAKIVQGLRSFSRDGSHDPFQQVNIHQLIDETLSLCSERFKSNGTQIRAENFRSDLCIEGRSTEVSQVLLNLLNNAHDAIEGFDKRWIKISVVEQSEWVEILVTDCGNGVPPELREKIFQPFFTTKGIGKGTGMGLSVSAGIVRGHGGELKLDTQCPNTRFVIRLPKKQSTALVA